MIKITFTDTPSAEACGILVQNHSLGNKMRRHPNPGNGIKADWSIKKKRGLALIGHVKGPCP